MKFSGSIIHLFEQIRVGYTRAGATEITKCIVNGVTHGSLCDDLTVDGMSRHETAFSKQVLKLNINQGGTLYSGIN